MRFYVGIIVLLTIINMWGCDDEILVQFLVIAPPDSPDTAKVFITGNTDHLGSWNPGKTPMMKVDDSTWEFSGMMPSGYDIQVKITLGSWDSQAIYAPGIIPDNIAFKALKDTKIVVRPLTWGLGSGMGSNGGVTGNVIYHPGIMVEGLHYPKNVAVWLPPGYEQNEERYPVLYMHDGQNVFDPATSFLGIDWQADETADSLIRQNEIRGIIIVAISNSPDRSLEYSSTSLGRVYARFLAFQLKPMIDSLYRTKSSREHTALLGSSIGGLISFLTAWWHPEVFSMAGCLSPAFGYDKQILKEVASYEGGTKSLKLYIDNGTVDLEERLQPGLEEMVKYLKRLGYEENKDLNIYIDEGATHNESAWAKRLWRPLMFFYAYSEQD